MTGQPFLTQQLSGATIVVEFAWGADLTASSGTWTWVDETANVRQANNIGVTQGRQDETTETSPASCAFELDNSSGKYTPYNPVGSLWPNVSRNTPVRVRLIISATSYVRFQGYADGFVPSWDESAKLPIVSVSASGALRRLTQGKSPIGSPLTRSISKASPAYYWPCEDSADATQIAAAAGSIPLSLGVAPKLASFDPGDSSNSIKDLTLAGSTLPVLDTSNGGSASAIFTGTTTSLGWTVQAGVYIDTLATAGVYTVLSWFVTGADREYQLIIDTVNNLTRVQAVTTGNSSFDISYYGLVKAGWNEYRFDYVYISGQPFPGWWTLSYGSQGSYTRLYFNATAAPQNVTSVSINPLHETHGSVVGVGHVRLWNTTSYSSVSAIQSNGTAGGGGTSTTNIGQAPDGSPSATGVDAWHAWRGENAVTRLQRLCTEQGVPLSTSGTSNVIMGAQPTDAFVPVLRDCETADHGFLADGLSDGLRYVSLAARYDISAALTADMSSSTTALANPFVPVDDDQRNRNSYTVSRANGGSAMYTDTSGPLGTTKIGTYDSSATVDVYDDSTLRSHAAWFVHMGTVEGLRYPTLALDIVATPTLATSWLGCGDNHRIDVTNVTTPAPQHPPYTVSLMVEGYSETLGVFQWDVTANCAPYSPYLVWVLGNTATDRVDSDSSTLASSVLANASSMSVATTGPLWTTVAGNYPLAMSVDGLKITVTGVSGASSPQTFTVTSATVLRAIAAGKTVSLWQPARPSL